MTQAWTPDAPSAPALDLLHEAVAAHRLLGENEQHRRPHVAARPAPPAAEEPAATAEGRPAASERRPPPSAPRTAAGTAPTPAGPVAPTAGHRHEAVRARSERVCMSHLALL